jgi:hypothetical protein
MDKQVAKINSAGALASLNLRADSGKGAEEIKSEDVSTPILKILHQLSPECNSRSAKHVSGAEPGMIYSNSFGTPIDGNKGLDVIVAHTQTRYPEWQEMGDSPSAPVGTHLTPPADAKEEMRGIKYRLSNGNYIEKTMYFFIIAMVDGTPRKAVITMRSSNLTPARKLNDLISNLRMTDDKGSFQPAAYSAVFKLQTAEKTNKGDKTWHVYKPSMVRMLDVSNEKDAAIYMMAQEFQKQVSTGVSKPKYEKVEEGKSEDII